MHQLQRSWVRSQHPSAQWNLRGGRWSSVEYCTGKEKKSPQKIFKKKKSFRLRWQISHTGFAVRVSDRLCCQASLEGFAAYWNISFRIRWQASLTGFVVRSFWLGSLSVQTSLSEGFLWQELMISLSYRFRSLWQALQTYRALLTGLSKRLCEYVSLTRLADQSLRTLR